MDLKGQKHTLNNINCYVTFMPEENLELYTAIVYAVQDWDWHLGILNSMYGTNYDMYLMSVSEYASQIVFKCNDKYIDNDPSILAETTFFDSAKNEISDDVVHNNANWSQAYIEFSQKYFDGVFVEEERTALMRSTANHEIGHALGLAHDPRDNGIIMYGPGYSSIPAFNGYEYNFYDATAEVPTLHDLLGVYYLYPPPPPESQ